VLASADLLLQAGEKPKNVPVRRIVVQDFAKQPTLSMGINGRQDTEGAVVQFVSRQVAGEIG
jgi:hypothetical protein